MDDFEMVHKFNGDARRTQLAIWHGNVKVYIKYDQVKDTNLYNKKIMYVLEVGAPVASVAGVKMHLESHETEKYIKQVEKLGYSKQLDMTEFLSRNVWKPSR